MWDKEWVKDKILPYFATALIAALLTSVWFSVATTVSERINVTAQNWVPKYTVILSGTSKCPSQNWKYIGRGLINLRKADHANMELISSNIGNKNIYEDVNIVDKELDPNLKEFDATSWHLCMKVN